MRNVWMPASAGTLDIETGILGEVIGLLLCWACIILSSQPYLLGVSYPSFVIGLIGFTGVLDLVLGTLAIIGGIHAVRRNNWSWALTGSIAAFFTLWPLGIAAIVFTALSKKEFE